jgi:hypothetical protein
MIPHRGDVFECPQCTLRVEVVREAEGPPLQLHTLKCVCGEELKLLQSGSESVDWHRFNKILEPATGIRS